MEKQKLIFKMRNTIHGEVVEVTSTLKYVGEWQSKGWYAVGYKAVNPNVWVYDVSVKDIPDNLEI